MLYKMWGPCYRGYGLARFPYGNLYPYGGYGGYYPYGGYGGYGAYGGYGGCGYGYGYY
jgi:outer membrane protein insertion porin family